MKIEVKISRDELIEALNSKHGLDGIRPPMTDIVSQIWFDEESRDGGFIIVFESLPNGDQDSEG